MARKSCLDCGNMVGVRTKECPDCGYKFLIKKRGPRPKEIDWTELKTGDIIKVVTGTGPYYLSKDKPGERIMMGEKGMFEVAEIIDSGPRNRGIYGHQLYGRSGKSHYREWIYMGESYYKKDISWYKEPHKVMGVKTEATVIESPKEKPIKKTQKKKEIDVGGLNDLIASL